MERRRLGSTDMDVSVLGFGGAEIGFMGTPADRVGELLNAAIDAGLNVVDTAECYNDSEQKIGDALKSRRSEFYLFSKCGHSSGFDLPDWDPKMLALQIERSLVRLQTDCLDLLQLHSCSVEILRQGEVIEVVQRAREAGKTRYIGYSGDREAAVYAVECGAFDTLQTSVNVADQQCLSMYLPLACERRMGVIAKRPVANAAWITEPPLSAYPRPYWERLQVLNYPQLNAPAPEAFGAALGFTLAQSVHTAIVGTTKPGRWSENAQVLTDHAPSDAAIKAIRDRWLEAAQEDWVGQG